MNLEPSVTMKVGGEKLKGVLQIGVTIPTINSNSYYAVSTSSTLGAPPFKFSVGVCYTVAGSELSLYYFSGKRVIFAAYPPPGASLIFISKGMLNNLSETS
jgi:hypothetical protein